MYGQQQQYGGQYGGQQQRPSFLQAQPTGFAPGGLLQQPTGFQQPQMTGYGIQPQMTGYPNQQLSYAQQQPAIPSVPQQYANQVQRPSFLSAPPQRQLPLQTGFSSISSQPTGFSGISSQPTGYVQQQQPMQAQFGSNIGSFSAIQHVPQMFTQTFLPANPSQISYNPTNLQFAQPSALGGQSLQQVYQQNLPQQPQQVDQIRVPWALSADERKNYDAIFRAWDQQGSGFITGVLAKEVFGQSGITTDDLMQIWNLSDVENRGKLNLAEFHVAMGLIFRRLNGNPIPNQLPPELIPPSSKDLNNSVDFLKDLLRSDTNARNTADPAAAITGSYAKTRTLHEARAPDAGSRKDATVYKHDDSSVNKTYKSSSRHLDRSRIRAANDDSPTNDLDDIRRQLNDSQALLDSSRDRDDADDALAQEKDDLVHEIRKVQSDIEHCSRGRRTEAKESERRRLDRELDRLKYERLPELERKIEDREREKGRDRRRNAADRDRKNDRYAKFDDRRRYEDDDQPYSRQRDDRSREEGEDEEEEKGYLRGTFDGRNDRSAASGYSTPSRREEARPRAPATPPAPAPRPAPEAPKTPAAKPAMTEAERKEFVKAEAAKRVQDRLRALGIGGETPAIDPAVAQRIEDDKKEAAAKGASADQEAADRAKQRQLKLEKEKLKDDEKEAAKLVQAEKTIQKMSDDVTISEMQQPKQTPTQQAAVQGAREELDREEAEIARREAELAEQRRQRLDRIKQLEAEEAEAARQAEEDFKRKKERFAAPAQVTKSAKPPAPPAPKRLNKAAPTKPAESPAVSDVKPAESRPAEAGSTNPFHRNQNQVAAPPAANGSALGANNPFNRNRQATAPIATPPRAPSPAKTPTLPQHSEDWDIPIEKNQPDDSDSDSDNAGRAGRRNLADKIFGGIVPGQSISRPNSAQANPSPVSAPAAPLPPPPAAASRSNTTPTPSPISAGLNGALLGQIQGGSRLKKAVTKDKSGPAVAGSVVGDADPPSHINSSANSESESFAPNSIDKRQSVDWVGGLASNALGRSTSEAERMPSHVEEDEEDSFHEAPTFTERFTETVGSAATGLMAAVGLTSVTNGDVENVNMAQSTRSRTLYAYSNPDKADDLTVEEDVILITHPAKDNDDWLYGKLSSGKSGWLPASYVVPVGTSVPFRALFDYEAASSQELSLKEGQTYDILEQSPDGWFKAEHNARALLVPSAYLEEEDLKENLPVIHVSADLSDDGASEIDEVEDESAKLERMAAFGLLTRNKRKPPKPPSSRRLSQTSIDNSDEVDDAYARWIALQRDLPPLPISSNRNSLVVPTPSIVEDPAVEIKPSSFFSRLTAGLSRSTPSPSQTRPSLTITRTQISSDSEGGDESIGKTWGSLIDKSALDALPDHERRRQEAMFELIATESAYVQSLQLVVSQFFAKLQGIVVDKLADIIFANIEDILLFNTTLLSDLEERQRESRLYLVRIDDILDKHIRSLDIYRPYCTNQSSARKTLEQVRKENAEVDNVLSGLRVNNLELEHYLLQPMQRLTRYPLLIGQILRYTDEGAEGYRTLQKCLHVAETVLVATNDAIKQEQDDASLAELSDSLALADDLQLDLCSPTMHMGKRRILKSGVVNRRRSSDKLTAWLFNDLLLLVTSDNKIYRSPLPLHEISIGQDTRHDDCFKLSHLGSSTVYSAGNARQAILWTKALEDAREHAIWSLHTGR